MSDLINKLLKQTYSKRDRRREGSIDRDPTDLRMALVKAKRFVLDDSMSRFLAHLATAPFDTHPARRGEVLSSLRHSAVLPYDKMVVQLNNREFRRGLLEASPDGTDVRGENLIDPDDPDLVPEVLWLIEKHPKDPGLILVSEFLEYDERLETMPYVWVFRTDDKPLPASADTNAGIFAHGLVGAGSAGFGVIYTGARGLADFPDKAKILVQSEGMPSFQVHALVVEFGGALRYIVAFLATLNATPTTQEVVRTTRGFMGGGLLRKCLDTITLKLVLPAKRTPASLARRVIAQARRRWHEVRPHWRTLHSKGTALCERPELHVWSEQDSLGHSHCANCAATRVWIVLPHGRGDRSIGVVPAHDFKVTTHGV